MKYSKVISDYIGKLFMNRDNVVPRGLLELNEYFRANGPIKFQFHNEDGYIVAVSENFRHGSIVTQAKNPEDLDKNVKDAILTAFDIPSAYKREASIRAVGGKIREYVLA